MQLKKSGKNTIVIELDLKKDLIKLKTGKYGFYQRWMVKTDNTSYQLQLLGFEKKAKKMIEVEV